MADRRTQFDDAASRGPHTLKVWRGTVVGTHGRDVFVELGPRMQGVIAASHFDAPPAIGEVHEFTLRGQEQGLWVLARVSESTLVAWNEIESGSLVQARVTAVNPGGFELKVGPLHAFMPRSHSGLGPREDGRPLIGKQLTCEVLQVDDQRQRVVLSRKLVLQRERDHSHLRQVGSLKIGQIVHGTVTRVETFGVFLRFGTGLEGFVHVSNLAVERPLEAGAVCQIGDTLEAKVLAIRKGGKRIALGVKQLQRSPWSDLVGVVGVEDVVLARVVRVLPFGAFVALRPGVEGLLPASNVRLPPGGRFDRVLQAGAELPLRIVSVDFELERMTLSTLHRDGHAVTREEAEGLDHLRSTAPHDSAAATESAGAGPRETGFGLSLRDVFRDLAAERKEKRA